jgi:serine/threonine protein kinase/Tol biopolymer transport system component
LLKSGTKIGAYEVVSLIGAGGMGEVYRARDARLNRDVALKVLPAMFASSPERMARFEREARLLASLNHPNIAAIYGLEESGPIRALVMELVEGPTLAERVASDPLPLDEALPIARQVADAVEYAHDNNVIHRDLKPANIKVKADGMVKVLDFGLAKALSDEPMAADMSNSPTLSMAATMQGVILGTAAYMSPEQAKGKTADRRADVWAFGVVLFEMLTGKQLYKGDTVAETLAWVITKDPPFDNLPANTPPAIRLLLRRCLEKDLRQRLQHAGEARITLEHAGDPISAAEPVAVQRKSRERIAWAATAIATIIAALGWGTSVYFQRAPEESQAVRFFVSPPDAWNFQRLIDPTGVSPVPMAVSPDGRRMAFVAVGADGNALLWVRSLDSLAAQVLPGTEEASSPFWSPDSRFLGFFAAGKLKKIDVAGGPPITLCDAPSSRGGSWSRDGIIVFNPANTVALQKVSAAGGTPTAATVLGQGENAHRRPFFLPDGRHFLYTAAHTGAASGLSIYVASLDLAERKLLSTTDANNVLYSQGHLLFVRETTLMAQPFDLQRLELTGDAFPIAEQIQRSPTAPSNGFFSASENGVLAYQTGAGASGSQLTWFDRAGKQVATLGDAAAYGDLELSPDGRRASVSLLVGSGARDIWLYDLQRGLRTRFTFDVVNEFSSIWSPDGSRVIFSSIRKGAFDLYQKPSGGAGAEELLFEDKLNKWPVSWSPDGRSILFRSTGGPTGDDLFILPLSGDPSAGPGQGPKPSPFLNSQFNEGFGQFSPDGRWIAYNSNESGRPEVYVAPFPGPGGKWQVSTAGGNQARWRRDGAEIFYLAPDQRLMAAAVNGRGSDFQVGPVRPLFQARPVLGLRYAYAVSPDGQRFLINSQPEQADATPITVVLNWTAGLQR